MFQHVTCLSWKMSHVHLENICFLLFWSGEGNGNPPQYPWLENPMEGGAWQATAHGVAKSWT